jgi:hypothetical protein
MFKVLRLGNFSSKDDKLSNFPTLDKSSSTTEGALGSVEISRVFRESKPRRFRSENRLKSKLLGNLPLWKSTSILVGKALSQVIPGLTQWISLRLGRAPNPTIFRIELEFDARSSRLDSLEKSVNAKTPEKK